jgi:hypothetical protein
MKNKMEKTFEQMQDAIDKNYKRVFILLAICFVLFIAFAIQIIK